MDKFIKKPFYKFLFCLFHSLFLLYITWFWLDSIWARGDEKSLIKWSSVIRRSLLKIDDKPPVDDFVFINLASEKELIPKSDGMGEEVITNRERLAKFFQVIQKHQGEYKYIICDVFFTGDSPNDSLLNASLKNIKNLVVPCHFEGNDLIRPKFNIQSGLADYTTNDDKFLKYRLYHSDTVKPLPVKIYEDVTGKRFTESNSFLFCDNRVSLKSVIIDYRIRTNDLSDANDGDTTSAKYPVYPLSEILLFQDDSLIFNTFLKEKYIVMGNFKEDVHSTVFGQMPGTVILLNIYLSLMAGENLISIKWLIFLYAGYFILSWFMLFPYKITKPKIVVRVINLRFFTFFTSAAYLTALSLVSYYYFNIHIGILFVAFYMNGFLYLLNHYKDMIKSVREFRWKKVKVYIKENYIG
jgi:hypothetical protein